MLNSNKYFSILLFSVIVDDLSITETPFKPPSTGHPEFTRNKKWNKRNLQLSQLKER